VNPVAQLLVIVAGLLLIGALGEFVFSRTGIPDVIWLVLAGIFAGPVFEVVSPRMLEPAVPFFGAIALTIISRAAPLGSDSRTLLQPRRAGCS
jgi:potassium/hydrogen antiporter